MRSIDPVSKLWRGPYSIRRGAAVCVALLAVMTAAQADPVSGQGTWETTLLGRDSNGLAVDASSDSAVFLYDTALGVTWLRNAGLYESSWKDSTAWASDLVLVVGGYSYSDWRLPAFKPVNGVAFQDVFSNNGSTDSGTAKTGVGWSTTNELGHLFYVTLGNKGACTPNDGFPGSCDPQAGSGLSNIRAWRVAAWLYALATCSRCPSRTRWC